jgi:hypothetical protein
LTAQDYIKRLKKKRNELAKKNAPFRIAVQTVHQLRTRRIFHVGLNSSASRIGTYDTKRELWVADDKLRKNGNHRGKTGKPIKTTYFKSYKDLKQRQGFQSDRVNLRLQNELQSDFANVNITKTSDAIPKGMPIKININEYQERLNKPINQKKVQGLVKKYGDIFGFTNGEKQKFYKTVEFEFLRLLK